MRIPPTWQYTLKIPRLAAALLGLSATLATAAPSLVSTVDLLPGFDIHGLPGAINNTTNRVYVLGFNDSVYSDGAGFGVIDTTTNRFVQGFDLGNTTAGNRLFSPETPYAIALMAVDESSNLIFIPGSYSPNYYLRIISGETNTPTGPDIALNGTAIAIGVNSATHRAYVLDGDGRITVVDGPGRSVVATITNTPLGGGVADGSAVCVNATTNKVYVLSKGNLAVVNGANNTATEITGIGSGTRQLAVSATTNRVYLVREVYPSDSVLTVVDGTSDTVIGSYSLPGVIEANAMTIDAATDNLFIAARGPHESSGGWHSTIKRVDGISGAVIGTLPVPVTANQILYSPAAKSLYFRRATTTGVLNVETGAFDVIATGALPGDVAVDKTRNRVYIGDEQNGKIFAVDGNTNGVVAQANSGDPRQFIGRENFIVPAPRVAVAVSEATNRVYASVIQDEDPDDGVSTERHVVTVFDATSLERLATIPLVSENRTVGGVAVDDVRGKVYVTSNEQLFVVDTDTLTATFTGFAAASGLHGVVVNPTTNKIYVTHGSGSGDDAATAIDGANYQVFNTIPVGVIPGRPAIDTQRNKIYVPNRGNSGNSITVIDGATDSFETTIYNQSAGDHSVGAVAVNPTTNRLYIADTGEGYVGWITAFDLPGGEFRGEVATDRLPIAIAVNATTGRIFTANDRTGTISVAVDDGSGGPGPGPGNEPRLWVAGRDLAANERLVGASAGTNGTVPQWSYGYRATVAGMDFTPFSAAEHTDAERDRPSVQGWASANGVVLANTGGQAEQYFAGGESYALLPDQMLLRRNSSNGPVPVVRWTAPEDGSYRTIAKWHDLDPTTGGGAAHVLVNGTQVLGHQQNGAFIGQEWADEGNAMMPTQTFYLRVGDVVDFVLGTRGLDSSTRDTGFAAAIVRVPTVSITAPSNGSEFVQGNEVFVSVSVDHKYGIKSVELRSNVSDAAMAPDTSAPYEFPLGNLKPGFYNLTAVATDEYGAEVASAPVQVIVRSGGSFSAKPGSRTTAAEGRSSGSGTSAATAGGRLFRCTQSGSWGDPATWGGEGVPGRNDDAIIAAGLQVDMNDRHEVHNLDIAGSLVANAGIFNPSLNVFGTMLARGARLGGEGLPSFLIETSGELVVTDGATFVAGGDFFNNGKTVIGENGMLLTGDVSNFKTNGTFQMRKTPGSNQPTLVRVGAFEIAGGRVALDNYSQLVVANGMVAAGAGNMVAAGAGNLIGSDGASLIGSDGASLIGSDGASLIGSDGASLIGSDGASMVAAGAGNLIGSDGASLIGSDGASLVSELGSGARYDERAAAKGSVIRTAAAEDFRGFELRGGAIVGNIDFRGNVLNSGATLSPGGSAGLVRVFGDYTQEQNGTLLFELAGTHPTQFDHLNITGTATLGGTLIVKGIDGFTPGGETFPPITYGAVSGQFGSVSGNAQVSFAANGMTMQVSGPNPPAPKALNIATRMRVETGDNVLIAGFIITGDQPKKVLIRGIGPSLPVDGALADPTLDLDGGTFFNDDWKSGQEQEIRDTTIPPSSELESAIVATLDPGAHTAVLRGKNDGTGVGLVEVYDLESGSPVQLANISTRGQVQTGDNVMIGGFIIGGNYPAKVLIRAIGPSLPIEGALQDPTLELVDSNGATISNDDWRATQEAEIVATTVPPTNDREAAIVATLVPGAYTAVVRGKDDTIGIALVEGYNLQ